MIPALVYVTDKAVSFPVPFGERRLVYSPKSCTGARHLISALLVPEQQTRVRRNVSLDPFDHHDAVGICPHASANVETRGESVLAARNTIDGVFANVLHGEYPYHSWGINRQAGAELVVEFGGPVLIDEVRPTLRADFPHDNYWTQVTREFADGSEEIVALEKTEQPQSFPVGRIHEWVKIKDLIMSDEPSPFPAPTQIEVWGVPQF